MTQITFDYTWSPSAWRSSDAKKIVLFDLEVEIEATLEVDLVPAIHVDRVLIDGIDLSAGERDGSEPATGLMAIAESIAVEIELDYDLAADLAVENGWQFRGLGALDPDAEWVRVS